MFSPNDLTKKYDKSEVVELYKLYKNKSMPGVYAITSPCGKKYIGQSRKNIFKRWKSYLLLQCKSQCHLYNSLKTYGPENHIFEIMYLGADFEKIDELEIYYISFFNTTNNKFGLNLRKGGGSGGELSDETRRKISEAQKTSELAKKNRFNIAEFTAGKPATNRGVPHTIETKEKIGNKNKGPNLKLRNRPKSDDHRNKISLTLMGKMVREKNPMYGKKHTDKSKQKIKEARGKQIFTDERNQKISKATKGENNPMYGRKHTKEARKIMREVNLGRKRSKESIENQKKTYWENKERIRQEKLIMIF